MSRPGDFNIAGSRTGMLTTSLAADGQALLSTLESGYGRSIPSPRDLNRSFWQAGEEMHRTSDHVHTEHACLPHDTRYNSDKDKLK